MQLRTLSRSRFLVALLVGGAMVLAACSSAPPAFSGLPASGRSVPIMREFPGPLDFPASNALLSTCHEAAEGSYRLRFTITSLTPDSASASIYVAVGDINYHGRYENGAWTDTMAFIYSGRSCFTVMMAVHTWGDPNTTPKPMFDYYLEAVPVD